MVGSTFCVAVLLLTALLPMLSLAEEPLCSWSQNGCTTTVYQWTNSWAMVIDCGSEGGSWSGSGEWGGYCP